ncbi:LD-carboxypeptidase [Streptomyces sp. ML-6]|uniref:LD-carboxypeptidase n=1 Tax=unclassified Streptomyces TaxID=2593676 RepID=UPI0024C0E11D|nr:LD-carboxypeptidase [Streptomyces sp. ML-6]MDK0518270.1 hypothetical protein [Streptomyces sp. ML-6]
MSHRCIDVEAITADPKQILGHSDILLLHLVRHARTGLVGFHTDLATPGLGGHWQSAPATRRAVLEGLYSGLLTGDCRRTQQCVQPGEYE